MVSKSKSSCLFACVFLNAFTISLCDDPITPPERIALMKFLPMVEMHLTQPDVMQTDGYLIRWIRARNMDLPAAKEMLLASLKWRKENDIDSYDKVDTSSAVGKAFPQKFTVDREGRPVFIQYMDGDIRKFVLTGKGNAYKRHMGALFELAERQIEELNIHNNNSEFIGIYDANGFSTTTTLCAQCLQYHLEHAARYERNYPLRGKAFYIVNAPSSLGLVLRLIAPIIGKTLLRIFTFSKNREEWVPELLKVIAPENLPVRLGGTMVE